MNMIFITDLKYKNEIENKLYIKIENKIEIQTKFKNGIKNYL